MRLRFCVSVSRGGSARWESGRPGSEHEWERRARGGAGSTQRCWGGCWLFPSPEPRVPLAEAASAAPQLQPPGPAVHTPELVSAEQRRRTRSQTL